MNVLGIVFVVLGVILILISPKLQQPRLKFTGLRVRGLTGPILIILGILILTGVISA
jgi:hypothetical protein